jgi:hypothetical protein
MDRQDEGPGRVGGRYGRKRENMKNFGLVVLVFTPLMGCVSGQIVGEVGSEGGTSGIGITGGGGSTSIIGDPAGNPDAGPSLGGTGGLGVPPTNVGAAGSHVVTGAGGSTGSVTTGMTLPCNVETMFKTNCQGCHSNPPVNGAPFSLVSYGDILANGANAVVAMSNGSMPLGGPRASDAMIQTVQSWVVAGFPSGVACPPTGGAAGASGAGGATPGVGGRMGTGGAPAPGVGGRTGSGGAPGVGGSPAPGVGGAGDDNGGDNGGGKGKDG